MAHGISVPSGGRALSRGSKRLLALRGDDHLVERLRRGDEGSFEVIYERHVPGLLSFCRHMLGSREEAEDAVQQALTAAHRDLLRDERDIRLKPWLYAIARNRCVSMLRARREQADEPVQAKASTDGLDGEVQRRAELRQLVADLQDLPENQRAALVLSELRDLSHAEVADVLDCEVANVKGLVFRARSGLSERREARDTACEAIREELATARGATLRRGKLRHHLRACAPCSAYLEDVRRQRKMMAAILPVVPTAGLKSGVLAAVGIGGGGAGAGGAAAGGGLLAALAPAGGATVAKVAIIGAVVVGGGGLVGEAALHRKASLPDSAPAVGPWAPAAVPAELDGLQLLGPHHHVAVGAQLVSLHELLVRSAPGGIDSAGAAQRKGSPATGPAAARRDRSKREQKRQRLEQKRTGLEQRRQELKRRLTPARGRSGRPPSAGRGRGSGGGRPVRARVRGGAPKVRNVPRRTRTRSRPVAPVTPKPKAKPRRQTGSPVGKAPASNVGPTVPHD